MNLTITSPIAGTTLAGQVTVAADYVSARPFMVATLTLETQTGQQVASDSALPISLTLDTTKLVDGAHTLWVNVKYKRLVGGYRWLHASVQVTVKNAVVPAPAPLTVTQNLTDGQTLTGPVKWIATPSEPVVKVEFLIDGVVKWTESYAPYQYGGDPAGVLDPTTMSPGTP